jgi:hypothetical protein
MGGAHRRRFLHSVASVALSAAVLAPVLSVPAPAGADDGALLACAGHGSVRFATPDATVTQPARYSGQPRITVDVPMPDGDCTGDLGATAGALAGAKFNLAGVASCAAPAGTAAAPMAGKLVLTYTNVGPAGRPRTSQLRVRLQRPPNPNLPDAVRIVGQVEKGLGAGAFLDTTVLLQPVPTADLDGNGTVDLPTESGPTMDSYLTWFEPGGDQPCTSPCAAEGACASPALRWDTDGAGLLALAGDDTAVLHSAFTLTNQPVPLSEDPPLLSCDASGRARVRADVRLATYPSTATGPCAGPLAGSTGDVTRVTIKLAGDGLGTCGSAGATPMHGTMVVTHANTDPVTASAYRTKAVVAERLEPGSGECAEPDDSPCNEPPVSELFIAGELLCLRGFALSAPGGAGGDVTVAAVLHPVPRQDWDGNGTIDVPTPDVPTVDSFFELLDWESNGVPQPNRGAVWSTSGAGFGVLFGVDGAVLDGGIRIHPRPASP